MSESASTPEELVLAMSVDELQELLADMGFEPTERLATSIRELVQHTGSLDASIVALHDAEVTRRAA
ncbi:MULTISPECIES: hypothetical protein [Crateriforma]|uniref:Uncharacterized protein n=1 Tax=Crateriforma conspicua TaxID=2527996 RepID=A0A5C6FZI4_9PLAN|nr:MULTISPECIES: hypothetical protein [Crateriforma]TWU66383.1 hypothetical protein V7x_19490 [Crateriforma conspicua]